MSAATAPDGCRFCGIAQRGHGRQHVPDEGWHSWTAPTDQQRLDRMQARRFRRAAANTPPRDAHRAAPAPIRGRTRPVQHDHHPWRNPMTDTSPVAELRAAAERIRTLAVDADDARPAPWAPGAAGSVISKGATGADYVTGYTTPSGTAVAAYIAAMHPGVGAALARLLEAEADRLVATARPDWHDHLAPHALAVARQILGSQR